MLALPIPDSDSPVAYGDLKSGIKKGLSVGELVSDLTKEKVLSEHGAHLDPDLIRSMHPRKRHWKPLLGQSGAAQGHLRNQGVGTGDVFLFFGLFRDAEYREGRWQFVKDTAPKHIIWGWMKVGDVLSVDDLRQESGKIPAWLEYHPHLQYPEDRNNTLYIASESDVFDSVASHFTLTASDASGPSQWALPEWFYPWSRSGKAIRTPLSFHQKKERWQKENNTGYCRLQCAARGQEFVLDADEYPEATQWLHSLIDAG